MKECRRGNRVILRCGTRKCRSTRSIRATNKIFYFTDSKGRPNTKMPLCDIFRRANFFVTTTSTIKQLSATCGNSTRTVCVWFHLFREVCTLSIEGLPKLRGTEDKPVQVDEAFFGGRQSTVFDAVCSAIEYMLERSKLEKSL